MNEVVGSFTDSLGRIPVTASRRPRLAIHGHLAIFAPIPDQAPVVWHTLGDP